MQRKKLALQRKSLVALTPAETAKAVGGQACGPDRCTPSALCHTLECVDTWTNPTPVDY